MGLTTTELALAEWSRTDVLTHHLGFRVWPHVWSQTGSVLSVAGE